jgi:DNA-3-methyladenine glycosylase
LRSPETPLRLTAPAAGERKRLLAGLAQPPVDAARFLLGKILVRHGGRRPLAARIVETEAYLGVDDPAAHAYGGRRTRRTEPLWGPPGTIYVYFIYGMYYCLNVSVEREGVPGCVLIRAAEPRGRLGAGSLRGPGRLCRTLRLDTSDSGHYLFDPAARLTLREGPPPARIGVSPRVGIRHAADRPLRFFDADSTEVTSTGRAR